MKIKHILLALFVMLAYACDNNAPVEEQDLITVATPTIMSKAEFRAAVDIIEPQTIKQSGKIYAYGNYIFVNDVNEGVHVIDNKDPKSPIPISYIKIPGNEDISIKYGHLYADSATDLLVFDISKINDIKLEERLEDVFDVYDFQVPAGADFYDWNAINQQDEIITGWTLSEEPREDYDDYFLIDFAVRDVALESASAAPVGQGGSLARFQIVDNYLYTVSTHNMSIFDITNFAEPKKVNDFYAGNNIETLFETGDYLYIGSTDGMYIYSLENPLQPELQSEFIHMTGCDPVVVQGDYAYLTLRGGNNCGQQDSVLEIINVSDKKNPELAARYDLENPYGLGIKDNQLFICDGSAGLKLYDLVTPTEIKLAQHFKNIESTDVIPLENSLVMIGDNILRQYDYKDDGLELLSSFSLKN